MKAKSDVKSRKLFKCDVQLFNLYIKTYIDDPEQSF